MTLKHMLHLDGTWKNQMDIFKLIHGHEFTKPCTKWRIDKCTGIIHKKNSIDKSNALYIQSMYKIVLFCHMVAISSWRNWGLDRFQFEHALIEPSLHFLLCQLCSITGFQNFLLTTMGSLIPHLITSVHNAPLTIITTLIIIQPSSWNMEGWWNPNPL